MAGAGLRIVSPSGDETITGDWTFNGAVVFAGSVTSSSVILAPDGTASAPAYSFSATGQQDVGFYRAAADDVGLAVGGSDIARFTSALIAFTTTAMTTSGTFTSAGNINITDGALVMSDAANCLFRMTEADAAASNKNWEISINGEALSWNLKSDSFAATGTFMKVDRTANTCDSIAFTTTVLSCSAELDIGGDLNHDGSGVGFYGTAPIAQAVLATGASNTVDDVITALQNLGLVKQS